ncbi:MAG: leucyl/phenylalanyl-tRNA--protein transferase [Gemmatimonadaceae bacterium]|nr:leucyl/phenylalanyl-tRNA--protein transferase [Phycisphaerae bacterium]NUQ10984.1 leucyl/phenylalanyl-tRNA--protein transferase [Gemmatimonadaceae bacterium]
MHGVPFTPDLEPTRLLTAYANGIFPMDVDGELCWFSPDPRAILPLDAFHVPRTLRQVVRQGRFEIRVDGDFAAVILACAERPIEQTWISEEIVAAYTRLHELGFAHSVEAWRDGELAGGLYGVALGGAFFGESMFHRRRDASKAALVALVERMKARGFSLLDVQWPTPHLRRFGVIEVPRREYLRRLRAALLLKCDFRAI